MENFIVFLQSSQTLLHHTIIHSFVEVEVGSKYIFKQLHPLVSLRIDLPKNLYNLYHVNARVL